MKNPHIQIILKPSKLLLWLWISITSVLVLLIWSLPRQWQDQSLVTILVMLPCLWAVYRFRSQQRFPLQLAWQDQVFYCRQKGAVWNEFEPKCISVKVWLVKFNAKFTVMPFYEPYLFSFFGLNTITILPDQLSEEDHRIWRLLLRYNHLN